MMSSNLAEDRTISLSSALGGGPAKWTGSTMLKSFVPHVSLSFVFASFYLQGCQYYRLPGSMMQPLGASDCISCIKNSCARLGVEELMASQRPSPRALMNIPEPSSMTGSCLASVPPLLDYMLCAGFSGSAHLSHANKPTT